MPENVAAQVEMAVMYFADKFVKEVARWREAQEEGEVQADRTVAADVARCAAAPGNAAEPAAESVAEQRHAVDAAAAGTPAALDFLSAVHSAVASLRQHRLHRDAGLMPPPEDEDSGALARTACAAHVLAPLVGKLLAGKRGFV